MTGHHVNAWEFGLLRAMDRKWLKVYSDLNPAGGGNTKETSRTIDKQ